MGSLPPKKRWPAFSFDRKKNPAKMGSRNKPAELLQTFNSCWYQRAIPYPPASSTELAPSVQPPHPRGRRQNRRAERSFWITSALLRAKQLSTEGWKQNRAESPGEALSRHQMKRRMERDLQGQGRVPEQS